MPRRRYVCALTPDQQLEVRRRLRQQVLAPRLRRRLETVRLAGQGWRVGRIAEQVGVSALTVRRTLQRFMASGLEELADRPKAGRPPKLSPADLDAAEGLLRQAAARAGGLDDAAGGRLAGGHPWRGDQPDAAGRVAAPARLPLGHGAIASRARAGEAAQQQVAGGQVDHGLARSRGGTHSRGSAAGIGPATRRSARSRKRRGMTAHLGSAGAGASGGSHRARRPPSRRWVSSRVIPKAWVTLVRNGPR
jgi:Winged helix-turn helix